MAKVFNSVTEIVNDQFYQKEVSKALNELLIKREKRPEAKPGHYYRRDWYNRMSESHQLNADFFIKNAEDILLKKSPLCSEVRSIVRFVCMTALQKTSEYYTGLEAEKEEQVTQ